MYVYMYNIDWIRARKIRISFFPFKLCELSISLVTGEGELLMCELVLRTLYT